jgi:tRNA U34 5-methylaminomethyl-2-thiouridine-forming methyltransferase MnmC
MCRKNAIKVLEVGFGTGLNALLTALEAERMRKMIYYKTLELYPVSIEETRLLNYPALLEDCGDLFDSIHLADWDTDITINPSFILHKVKGDFMTYSLTGLYDVVYFDAFSPEKQPGMWHEAGFRTIIEHCNPDAILTTYCAKGSVRRTMEKVGFQVERLSGPPGKREVLRGRVVNG